MFRSVEEDACVIGGMAADASAYALTEMRRRTEADSTTTKPCFEEDANPSESVGKKSVRFSEDLNVVVEVTHLNDLQDEDVTALWYDEYEYAMIKANRNLSIYMIESGKASILDEDNHTPRGLENRTREGSRRRNENKQNAYSAVFDEQHRQLCYQQKKKNDNNYTVIRPRRGDVSIASLYSKLSAAKCAREAVARALLDQKEAMKILGRAMPDNSAFGTAAPSIKNYFTPELTASELQRTQSPHRLDDRNDEPRFDIDDADDIFPLQHVVSNNEPNLLVTGA